MAHRCRVSALPLQPVLFYSFSNQSKSFAISLLSYPPHSAIFCHFQPQSDKFITVSVSHYKTCCAVFPSARFYILHCGAEGLETVVLWRTNHLEFLMKGAHHYCVMSKQINKYLHRMAEAAPYWGFEKVFCAALSALAEVKQNVLSELSGTA